MTKEKYGKLTDKQDRFCREYVIDLNATQAAIRAGYSKRSARSVGCENLTKPNIQKRIQALGRKVADKLELTAERVLMELQRIAFFDPSDLFNESGKIKPLSEIPEDARRVIAGIDCVVSGGGANAEDVQKLKLHDKKGALELLGKHLKLFTEKVEHSGDVPHTFNINLIDPRKGDGA